MGMWSASAALTVLVLTVPAASAAAAPQSRGVWDRRGQSTSRPTPRGTTDFETRRHQDPLARRPAGKRPPVGQSTAQQPTPVAPPGIRTDANGWPILAPSTTQHQPVQQQTPNVQTRQVQTPKQLPGRVPARPGGPGTPNTNPRGPLERPLADSSLLNDVFQQVGRPDDVAQLQCVVAWMTVKLFDHRGMELGELQVHHEADLRHERDRLLFSRPSRGPDKIYGRDGRSVFAERHGMAWPSLESKAREELEIFGLLLRMPWAFADSDGLRLLGCRRWPRLCFTMMA